MGRRVWTDVSEKADFIELVDLCNGGLVWIPYLYRISSNTYVRSPRTNALMLLMRVYWFESRLSRGHAEKHSKSSIFDGFWQSCQTAGYSNLHRMNGRQSSLLFLIYLSIDYLSRYKHRRYPHKPLHKCSIAMPHFVDFGCSGMWRRVGVVQ